MSSLGGSQRRERHAACVGVDAGHVLAHGIYLIYLPGARGGGAGGGTACQSIKGVSIIVQSLAPATA